MTLKKKGLPRHIYAKSSIFKRKLGTTARHFHIPVLYFFLYRPSSVVAYFRLIFDQPMGEEASTSYLQKAAEAGVLGDVDADSVAALQFFPGKPTLTPEEGRVGLPGFGCY